MLCGYAAGAIIIWGFGVLAPASKWNGDFAPIFSTLRIYPYLLETKVEFAPIPWKTANSVKITLKRPICPSGFAPTIIWIWWFYPYFEYNNIFIGLKWTL